ncbi:hypothetical protein MLD38_013354 [Melastoma candidum]|uniref:Uncharacterized protein n=1 Tax=Melastoma candidum TaxID=119954 RepID=A0ACB9R8X8_9MYRT|nr:hypothetical protein MLD38_013354 [Melastoma candidum]
MLLLPRPSSRLLLSPQLFTEGGIQVNQIFFQDPDGYMVEIYNCENLPVLPISSCPLKVPKPANSYHEHPQSSEAQCTVQVAAMMMENLLIDMVHISILKENLLF